MRTKHIFILSFLLLIIFTISGCVFAAAPIQDERSFSTQKDDASIKYDVQHAINSALTSYKSNLNTYCFYGHIYIVGEAGPQAGEKASSAARKVKGVKGVTTKFFPLGTATTSDSLIQAKVDGNLLVAKNVTSNQVDVEVWGGHVVLLGIMESNEEIERAVKEARKTSGVKGVTNFLRAK